MEILLELTGPRTYFVLVLFAGLITLTVYRKANNRKAVTFTSGFIALLLLLNGYSEYRLLETQAVGSIVTAEVSQNKKSHLKCQRFSAAFFDAKPFEKGFVMQDAPNTAVVKYQTCKDLQKFLSGNKENPSQEEAFAFAILIHEAVHTSGEFSESMTECVTHRKFIPAAVNAGVTEETAAQMLNTYLTVYHSNQAKKYQYKEGHCDEHRLLPTEPEQK